MSHRSITKAAELLGISVENVYLESNGDGAWRLPAKNQWKSVEDAVLDFYRENGWGGFSGEADTILTTLKAASFSLLPTRFRSTFIEAIYAQNLAFSHDKVPVDEPIRNIENSTREQIIHNLSVMYSPEVLTTEWGTNDTNHATFFPNVTPEDALQLYDVLGKGRLTQIAREFAKSPYDYRKGWPDLTLFRGNELMFVEVKTMTDTIRASQRKTVSDVLVRLGLAVHIVIAC